MKRIFSMLACLAVLLSLTVPAFATEVEETEISEETTEPVMVETAADEKQIVVNVEVVNSTPTETTTETEGVELIEEYDMEETVSYASYSVVTLDETESETIPDSIPAAVEALFGKYTPRTQTVTEYLDDGSEVTYQEYVPGLAGLDWTWLSSVTIFIVFLYCVLRAIGGCLKWI